jgi:hypothetical protein
MPSSPLLFRLGPNGETRLHLERPEKDRMAFTFKLDDPEHDALLVVEAA